MHRFLTLVHLYIAAFLAPGLLLMSISGGLYLFGIKGNTTDVEISLPAGTAIDFKSPSFEQDVRTLLSNVDSDYDFEYVRQRGKAAQTRPTSRPYYTLNNESGSLSLTKKIPDLQASMIELHKGHGPSLFKTYSKIVAIGLVIIVISGLWLGLYIRRLRTITFITTAGGLFCFGLLLVV